MCSMGVVHQWSLAVFLLVSPLTLDGRPMDVPSNRTRRSVSHTQLMHDKGRSLQEFKRRMWLQELLDEVHTADASIPPFQGSPNSGGGGGGAVHQKPPGGTKNLPVRFRTLDPEGDANLPQETNKVLAYKDQPLKAATKRKKKVRLGRRKESEKKRKRARRAVAATEAPHTRVNRAS
uniref:Parathyroid hormone-like hormone b n=1 Tax=Gadus morhua TaxID=8049 RepID=A0A8C5F3T4_GADMO